MMMKESQSDLLICGAGIAGIAAAYFLVQGGVKDILLVDERPPLSLTSDKSTEAYRNWWPGPDGVMVPFLNHSLDLLEGLAERSGNAFALNRRGYVFATGRLERVDEFRQSAELVSRQGGGILRVHTGAPDDPAYLPHAAEGIDWLPGGADLILDPVLRRRHFPYLNDGIRALLHIRRAGWFSGQQLGAYLLEQAKAGGARLLNGRVMAVRMENGRVAGVTVQTDGGRLDVRTPVFVNAAGPFVAEVGRLTGDVIPVYHELHLKAYFNDPLGVIPRAAPLLIWDDPQTLDWPDEAREYLAEADHTRPLLDELPAGVHVRPEGGLGAHSLIFLWPYHTRAEGLVFPIPLDELYPEVCLRGMAAMLPGLSEYFERLPRPFMDGGYYTKTRENRFLAGPLEAKGAYVIGALSGYGLMAACGAADLLAAHILGESLPDYAPAFSPQRYHDPAYLRRLDLWDALQGQL
jgi:glycine/D-amino acid oxidase-like deaminating enzyme